MLEMLLQWYRRRFTDPQAIALLVIRSPGSLFSIFARYSDPVAGRHRAGLSAGVADRAPAAHRLFTHTGGEHHAAGVRGRRHAAGVRRCANRRQQGINLMSDLPGMLNQFYNYAATLPKRYPALVDAGIIDMMAENLRSRLSGMGESVVKFSLASLVGLLTLAIYLILVPMMMFFLLKDKEQLLNAVRRVLPRNRGTGGAGLERDESADHQLHSRQGAGDGDCRRGDLRCSPCWTCATRCCWRCWWASRC